MSFVVWKKTKGKSLLAAAIFAFTADGSRGASVSDLTIEITGDLLRHGGVVTVYPIPTSAEAWGQTDGKDAPALVRLDSRYAQVQLRYPDTGTFAYRFRPVEQMPDGNAHNTQVLSIIGTDTTGRGPQMTMGFKDAYSDGGRTIRVPPIAELTGQDEATRTASRWGETEGNDAVPPADERSARALVGIIEQGTEQLPHHCAGDTKVQVCTIAANQWSGLEARWWRAIAEQRLERLMYYALRRCYDSSLFGGGTCDADPSSNEPDFQYRN